MNKKSNLQYVFVVVALLALQGGFIGMLVNCTGILLSAVMADMGFTAGKISLYYTVRALAQAATVGFTAKCFFEKNQKLTISVMGVLSGLSFILMYFYNDLWQWYISGALNGVGMSCVLVVIPVVINNWFKKKNGLIIGISMAASGLFATVFGPVLSKWILAYGWRKAAVILGVTGAVVVIVPTILFLNLTPEKLGLKPYGYEEDAGDRVKKAQGKSYNMPGFIFPLCLVSIIAGSMLTQFMNQIPTFAASIGYSLTVGAMINSCSMIGNVGGKLAMGALSDKIGIFKALYLALSIVFVSMVLFIVGQGSINVLYAASLCYGMCYSLGTTAPSLVFYYVYGEGYKSKLSKFQSVNAVVLAFASSIFGFIYDFAGSYTPDFIFGGTMAVLSIIGFVILRKNVDKIKAQQ